MGALLRAREEGLVRYVGFSAHTQEAALALLDRFPFDSVLFPFSVVCSTNGRFGPRVLQEARVKGAARLALKAMAYSPWETPGAHPWPNCWYRPIEEPALAQLALRWTLSDDVTAALPPGEEALFRIAMDAAESFAPLTEGERSALIDRIRSVEPLFKSPAA